MCTIYVSKCTLFACFTFRADDDVLQPRCSRRRPSDLELALTDAPDEAAGSAMEASELESWMMRPQAATRHGANNDCCVKWSNDR